MHLRDYQQTVYDRLLAAWQNADVKNVLVVMPTGAGKTVFFGHALNQYAGASCAIAHRRELVTQMSLALARYGLRHRVIGPKDVQRLCTQIHTLTVGRSFVDPGARCAVASVDTLIGLPESDPWLKQVGLVVQDECFQAGTLIDGKPIEQIRVGDVVTAYNDTTKGFERRQVMRLFRNPAPENMVRLSSAHHVLECTPGHPVLTRRGWECAARLKEGDEILVDDVHAVRDSVRNCDRADGVFLPAGRSGVLQSHMLDGVPRGDIERDDGGHESARRIIADERAQPDEAPRSRGEDGQHAPFDRALADAARGQRPTTDGGGRYSTGDVGWPRVRRAAADQDWAQSGLERVPAVLQAGSGQLVAQVGDRGRRTEPQGQTSDARREERRSFVWARVDRVEVLKRADTDAARRGVCDGSVYNFEVDGLHTYVANGVVVHNCHHVLKENKWGAAGRMFPSARTLGVTATPMRADNRGLGENSDGIFHEMIVGPSMRELINRKFLCDYRIFVPPGHQIELSAADVSATTGDYSTTKMRKAVHKAQITGDVVRHYCEIARGKLGITFAVDVEAATELAQTYRDAGVPAEVITANTDPLLRASIMRRFRNREIHQLCNVDILGEGVDVPAVEVVSMGRPTQSYGLFAQQFGRMLRPLEGKTHGILLDHVGNVMRHGLPDRPREWSLAPRERARTGGGGGMIRICLGCPGAFERWRSACPYCGWTLEPAGRSSLEQTEGVLGELDPSVLAALRGEVAQADRSPAYPHGADSGIRARLNRLHADKCREQASLRQTMQVWGGWQTDHEGLTQDEAERRFYYEFGVDLISAWLLPRAEAQALRERIERQLTTNGVTSL